jgi:hypothetical protein
VKEKYKNLILTLGMAQIMKHYELYVSIAGDTLKWDRIKMIIVHAWVLKKSSKLAILDSGLDT